MNIASEKKEDFAKIKKVVSDLKLKNKGKLILNYNETVGRMKYRNATIGKRTLSS
jgi:glycerol-3-phosphate O-acyltransferase